jgi:hypothetical protein
MSVDFVSVADEPAPVPDPVAGDVAVLPGLADGEVLLVSLLDGLLDSVPEPPPEVEPPVAAGPDADPAPLPLPLPVPPLCANADVASIAPATVSASALIHVFITVLLVLLNCPAPG